MIRKLWCRFAHSRNIAFAGGSTYRCNRCLLEYPTPWHDEQAIAKWHRAPETDGVVGVEG